MRRYRYMVVRHHKDVAAKMTIVNGRFENHLPIHHLLLSYHWTRMNDEFVLVYGEYAIGHHNALADHEHVLMLPSTGSAKNLLQHGEDKGKKVHAESLIARYKSLHSDSTLSDLLDELESTEAPLLVPIR